MPQLQYAAGTPPTAGQVGVREELADYLAVVDAKSTPFVSMVPKGKDLGNMTFSWQVDNYSDPYIPSVPDGADITVSTAGSASSNRKRMSNYAQVFRRDHRTGFIADTQKVAGVSSETARGVAKRLVEIKRDMEAAFLATSQATAPTQTNANNLGAGLGYTLTTAEADSTVGKAPVGYGATLDTTTTAALTEGAVQTALSGIYGKTGTIRDYDVICGTALRRAFTNLTSPTTSVTATSIGITATQVRTFNSDLADSTLKSSIDIFEGDFGRLMITPDVFIGSLAAVASGAVAHTPINYKGYIIPSDMVEIRYAKLPEVKDLPDAGGGAAKLIQAIAGLVVKNPSGFGMFNGAS